MLGLLGLNSMSLNLPIIVEPDEVSAFDHVCPPSGLILMFLSVTANKLSV